MGISLYRQYRPQKFSEVAGQPAAVDVIAKSLERSRIGHAYLFSGPRGCGKTTVARLLAKALNCLAPEGGWEPCCACRNCLAITAGESLDVIEIDGASNNSVDEVRELKSHVTLAPFSSKYKIYIIDEVHMLSISAFNALLKTLEEPPAYVVFVLATTEAHKVPVTIRSRCQHIPFHRIGTQEIYDRLVWVCSSEGVEYRTEALWEIARQADGALRDALSMLEQVANLGKESIVLADVEATLGQGSRSALERWFAGWHGGDMETFRELDRMLACGASPQRLLEELFSLSRNLWLAAKWKGIPDVLDISEQEKEYLKAEAPSWQLRELESVMEFLAQLLPQARMGLRMDVLSGLLMAKMTHLRDEPTEPPQAPGSKPKAAVFAPRQTATEPRRESPSAPSRVEEPERKELPKKTAEISIQSTAPTAEAAPLDSSSWEPCLEDRWSEAVHALYENEFVLYCALLGARGFQDGNKLILDIGDRYVYEVLRSDRNRSALKKAMAFSSADGEVLLRHGALWVSCDSARKDEEAGKKADKNGKKRLDFADFDQLEFSTEEGPEPKEARVGGVPFDGLVREVTRWMRGDVILVKRSGDDDDDAEPAAVEE